MRASFTACRAIRSTRLPDFLQRSGIGAGARTTPAWSADHVAKPGAVPAGGRLRVDGRHDRVRDGHRQAGCRFVAHLDLPRSVEGYYQETGRAGRDGLPATAWMAYGLADVVLLRRMIDTSEGDDAHRRRQVAHLDAMLALCETVECRRRNCWPISVQETVACGNYERYLTPPLSIDGTIAAQKLLSAV